MARTTRIAATALAAALAVPMLGGTASAGTTWNSLNPTAVSNVQHGTTWNSIQVDSTRSAYLIPRAPQPSAAEASRMRKAEIRAKALARAAFCKVSPTC